MLIGSDRILNTLQIFLLCVVIFDHFGSCKSTFPSMGEFHPRRKSLTFGEKREATILSHIIMKTVWVA